jgi:hypothetical protein
MFYRIGADIIVVLHLVFILFVVFGGGLALRWSIIAWFHIPAALWGALIEFGGWVCPLTPLENILRRAGGAAGYGGGFIHHYLMPVIYPVVLNRTIQIILGFAVIALNGVLYGFIIARTVKGKKEER